MVENQNNIRDDLSLTLDEFNSIFGLTRMHPEDILSETGLSLLSSTFVSIDMIRTVFALSPIFQNKAPEYDHARGLIYDVFLTLLCLHSELMTIFKLNHPEKSKIH
jgi:hypothetical protein